MRTIFLCAFALLLTACACQKKIPKLTTAGANKVYCLINGQKYESMTDLFAPGVTVSIYPLFSPPEMYISSNLYKKNSPDYGISIHIKPFHGIGKYDHANASLYFTFHESFADGKSYDSFKYGNIGEVEVIHYDERNGIVSGRFNFEIIENEKTIYKIENGTFDVKRK